MYLLSFPRFWTLFILIYFEWRDTENQQYPGSEKHWPIRLQRSITCELFYLTVVHGVGARNTSNSSPGSFSLALEKRPGDEVGDTYAQTILGLQARDKAAMLMFNTISTLINTLNESGVKILEERNAFIFDPQHGGRLDVRQVQTSKESCLLYSIPYISLTIKHFCLLFL